MDILDNVLFFDDALKTILNYLLTTALGGLITYLCLKIKQYKKRHSDLEKILVENTLLTCKAIIYSENPAISINERIKSYKLYSKLGGNGEARLYMAEQIIHCPPADLDRVIGETAKEVK